jgi:hypothetical protein
MKYPEQITVPVTPEQLQYLHSIKRTSCAEELRRMIDAERLNVDNLRGSSFNGPSER